MSANRNDNHTDDRAAEEEADMRSYRLFPGAASSRREGDEGVRFATAMFHTHHEQNTDPVSPQAQQDFQQQQQETSVERLDAEPSLSELFRGAFKRSMDQRPTPTAAHQAQESIRFNDLLNNLANDNLNNNNPNNNNAIMDVADILDHALVAAGAPEQQHQQQEHEQAES